MNQRQGQRQGRNVRLRHLRLVKGTEEIERSLPLTRAECVDGPRPCPYVSCVQHLFLDGHRPGHRLLPTFHLNFPTLLEEDGPDLERMTETCALDVAERGGMNLAEVAELLGVTKEAIRQTEEHALKRLGYSALKEEIG